MQLKFCVTHHDTFPSPGVCAHQYSAQLGISFGSSFDAGETPGYSSSPITNYQNGTEMHVTRHGGGPDTGGEGAAAGENYPTTYIGIGMEYYNIPTGAAENMGFKSNSYHSFGIVYYDDANRSSSVQPIHEDKFMVANYDRPSGTTYSQAHIGVEIHHEAPSWATGWQLVYSGNRNIDDSWRYRIDGCSSSGNNVIVDLIPIGNSFSDGGQISKDYDWVEGDRV